MFHSYSKMYIHLVWSVKDRRRMLTKDVRPHILQHIAEYSIQNKMALDALNVHIDHVHAFLNLKSDQKVEEIVKLLIDRNR